MSFPIFFFFTYYGKQKGANYLIFSLFTCILYTFRWDQNESSSYDMSCLLTFVMLDMLRNHLQVAFYASKPMELIWLLQSCCKRRSFRVLDLVSRIWLCLELIWLIWSREHDCSWTSETCSMYVLFFIYNTYKYWQRIIF